MNSKTLALIATAGSAALLLGALGFQYIGDLAPCKMCIWQRWPHGIAVVIGAAFLITALRPLLVLGALSALTTSLIGFFHAGVEQGWWEGPTTCTSGPIGGLSTDDLLASIMDAPLVRCDDIAWSLGGISMAGWNGIISLGLVVVWAIAWRRNLS